MKFNLKKVLTTIAISFVAAALASSNSSTFAAKKGLISILKESVVNLDIKNQQSLEESVNSAIEKIKSECEIDDISEAKVIDKPGFFEGIDENTVLTSGWPDDVFDQNGAFLGDNNDFFPKALIKLKVNEKFDFIYFGLESRAEAAAGKSLLNGDSARTDLKAEIVDAATGEVISPAKLFIKAYKVGNSTYLSVDLYSFTESNKLKDNMKIKVNFKNKDTNEIVYSTEYSPLKFVGVPNPSFANPANSANPATEIN